MRKLNPEERKVQISIMIDPGLLKTVDQERKEEKVTRSSWINANLNKIFDMEFSKPRSVT